MREIQLIGLTANELVEQITTNVVEVLSQETKSGDGPVLLTREETSKRLCISLSTLDKLVREEVIPSIPLNTKRLFDIEDVVAALKDDTGCPNTNRTQQLNKRKSASKIKDSKLRSPE